MPANPLTRARLSELRAIERDMTSATWNGIGGTVFCDGADDAGRGCFILYDRSGYEGAECNKHADCVGIAESRNALPELLDAIEGAWATIDEIRTELDDAAKCIASAISTAHPSAFDMPPEPASEWDCAAAVVVTSIRNLLDRTKETP